MLPFERSPPHGGLNYMGVCGLLPGQRMHAGPGLLDRCCSRGLARGAATRGHPTTCLGKGQRGTSEHTPGLSPQSVTRASAVPAVALGGSSALPLEEARHGATPGGLQRLPPQFLHVHLDLRQRPTGRKGETLMRPWAVVTMHICTPATLEAMTPGYQTQVLSPLRAHHF
mmetsp:Transcript_16277/g.33989  ORF Transcript_16277/g.33989 Transcript_16277/m.33989 type:complete len:170 (-) Transcript_16277:121-630(-)